MIELVLQAERALNVGLVGQAETLYRTVLDADPRNSIAMVGLARVAVERGDDEAALGHAREALRIDPQNAAALRMEARLRELGTASRPDPRPATPGTPAGQKTPAPTTPAPTTPDEPPSGPEPATSSRRGLLSRVLGR